jgi:phytanoyl-CoA hydroxylase
VDALLDDLCAICDGSTLANHSSDRLEMEPNQGPDGNLVRRIYQPCTHYQRFRDLSESNELLDSIERLIGPDILFHYSKVNMKPPTIGSVVEWHQDLLYYPLTNRDSLAILIYLDDADKDNGCLQVLPGRHLLPPMSHSLHGYFQGRITEPVDESQAVFLEGRAGTAIFLHCMTPHASTLNTSDKPRRTLILSYRSSDAFVIFPREGDTAAVDVNSRHVRGRALSTARFTEKEFPIPRLRRKVASLYELQESSRREEF